LCSQRSSGDEVIAEHYFSPIVLSAPLVEQPLQARGNCSSFHQRASYSFSTIWQKAGVPTASFASLVALLTWRDLLFCAKHLLVAAIGGRVRVICAAPCALGIY
jgi:hypothetical protein